MKSTIKYLIIIFFILLTTQSTLIAGGSVSFGGPANNAVYHCDRGGYAAINVYWGVDELDPYCYMFYTKCFVNDQIWVQNGWNIMASGVFTAFLGVGTYTLRVELVQYTIYMQEIAPHPSQTITIEVRENPTHGTTTSESVQVGPGSKENHQTSSYISPGSNVAWTLRIMGYANTTGVSAFARLAGIVGIQKDITSSDGYYNNLQNDTISNFSGGTITLETGASVASGYSGNASATATITW